MLKKFSFVILTVFCVAALASCGVGSSENAEDYPSDDINITVPYAAGGPTDIMARSIAPHFEEELGQTVIVENFPGGSGAVGTTEMLSSEPDGHTLQLFSGGTAIVTPLVEDVGYTHEDILPIGIIQEIPSTLLVRSDSAYETAEEVFEAAEADPGELSFATAGASTPQAVELQRLNEEYGVELSPVPFDGNGEAISALLGGNVDGALLNSSEDVVSQLDAGELRSLAITSEERVNYAPDTPTFAEIGYEELSSGTSIFGLAASAETPQEIIAQLEATLDEALEDPEIVEQIGEEYVPAEFLGSEETQERIDEYYAAYEPFLAE